MGVHNISESETAENKRRREILRVGPKAKKCSDFRIRRVILIDMAKRVNKKK